MLNIALFGPPGAGKGTQSKMLIEKYNLMYISTGDLLRQEIQANTSLGLQAKDTIAKGGLASDELIMEIIENRIEMHPDAGGILFDGFPRTVVQAYILDGLMQRMHTRLLCMLSLEVPTEELMHRLIERGKDSGRNDDTKEVIEYRLKEYEQKTVPVAQYYHEKSLYFPVLGVGKLDEIFNRLVDIVEQEASKKLLNVVLCGFPGSGKRSNSLFIEEKYGLVPISTGKLIREEIQNNTEMGRIAKPFIERGDNVPDEIAIRLIETKISQSLDAKGFIFKGFPSTFIQAYILDGILKKMGTSISCALNLDTSALSCMKRLTLRGKSSDARIYDKDPETIIHRLEVYEHNSKKILEYYDKQHLLYSISGTDDIEKSHQAICEHIDLAYRKMRD